MYNIFDNIFSSNNRLTASKADRKEAKYEKIMTQFRSVNFEPEITTRDVRDDSRSEVSA